MYNLGGVLWIEMIITSLFILCIAYQTGRKHEDAENNPTPPPRRGNYVQLDLCENINASIVIGMKSRVEARKKFHEEVREAILGETIDNIDVDTSTLVLGNGTVLKFRDADPEDPCAGSVGKWDNVNNTEAGITDVEFSEWMSDTREEDYAYRTMTITILHGEQQLVRANCVADGGDGGYYSSVLILDVEIPDKEKLSGVVLEQHPKWFEEALGLQ